MSESNEPLRWGLDRAAGEFGLDRRTLLRRLKEGSIAPGEDGKYSTAQICAAIYGSLYGERLRKTREEADAVALANAKTRGDLVDYNRFLREYQGTLMKMINTIESSGMTDQEKFDIRTVLAHLEVAETTGKGETNDEATTGEASSEKTV